MSIRLARAGLRAAALALVVAALPACSSMMAWDRADDFELARERFTQYVRFGDISRASAYVDPEQRDEFMSLEPELSDVRFTEYEVVAVDLDDEARSARVDLRFSGYIMPEMVERNVDLVQEWARDDESGEWLVKLEIAKIRRVLAGGQP